MLPMLLDVIFKMESYWQILFAVHLLLKLCATQPTSGASCSTCSIASTCRGCNVDADVITTSSTSWSYQNPETGTPFMQLVLLFTAYSVTSSSFVSGSCIRHTGPPVPLVAPSVFFMHRDNVDYISASFGTADYSVFLDRAYSSLYISLGYEGCTATIPSSPVVPMFFRPSRIYLESPLASATALPSAAPVESSASVRHTHTTRIIIISVVVPTCGLVIPAICFIVIRKYRKRRMQEVPMDTVHMTSDTQLYVDRKAELEDEERRKYELAAGGQTHELEGQDRIFEMPGDGDMGVKVASFRERHELRGAEHSKELEVPSNVS